MKAFEIPSKNTENALALGAESAGNFSAFKNGKVYFSEDFGDLLEDSNFRKYKHKLDGFLKKHNLHPDVILCDLHPFFKTTTLAEKLAKKYDAKIIHVQHHIAHIFSAIGDEIISKPKTHNLKPKTYLGIACDGTGYGLDEKIWGGEIFSVQESGIRNQESGKYKITRVGHLENQIMLGGEKAIQEPARLIISIINKFPISNFQFSKKYPSSNIKNKKGLAYYLIKKNYSKKEFELLWSQLQQNFNCIETSSTARVLDAVSVLLGFSKNERLEKHGPVYSLENNSTKPYSNLKPKIETQVIGNQSTIILNTTHLLEYLIKNLYKDKKRLAATAQKYIADGLVEIIKDLKPKTHNLKPVFFAGGMANNKIISSILEKNGFYTSKKIPRGDGGISIGQIIYYILANPRN